MYKVYQVCVYKVYYIFMPRLHISSLTRYLPRLCTLYITYLSRLVDFLILGTLGSYIRYTYLLRQPKQVHSPGIGRYLTNLPTLPKQVMYSMHILDISKYTKHAQLRYIHGITYIFNTHCTYLGLIMYIIDQYKDLLKTRGKIQI